MSKRKILVLCGHPNGASFCAALAERYARSAEAAGHDVRSVAISDVPVDFKAPNYRHEGTDTDWVLAMQEQLAWCEHLVLVTPMWWGGVPAALKALLDRVLTPGFAFRYHAGGLGWDKLLEGRSARLIITADTPWFYFRWFLGRPLVNQLRKQVFGFCGFSPVRVTFFAPIKTSSKDKRNRWLDQIEGLGREAA